MAAGSKAGLYQNAQSASYLPQTLVIPAFFKRDKLESVANKKHFEHLTLSPF